MITVPHTYAEWTDVLDVLQAGTDDQEAVKAMKQGTLEWQIGIAERFSKKLLYIIDERMNQASDRFQREMSHAGGTEGSIVRALLALRKELTFLADAVDLPTLPQDIKPQFKRIVSDYADKVQKNLEESAARGDRTGKLTSIVRNNKVNVF